MDNAIIVEALDALSMTQCPAYKGNGQCESGCHYEPRCQCDEPTEGWIEYAIGLLLELRDPPRHASAIIRDPDAGWGKGTNASNQTGDYCECCDPDTIWCRNR